MQATNLPPVSNTESAEEVRAFFDKYFQHQITFPSNQIDGVLGFFLKRGFQEQAAKSTAIVLLNQARLDGVNVFQLVDTLSGLTDVQLSRVVTEVMNAYREKTSALGFKSINYTSKQYRTTASTLNAGTNDNIVTVSLVTHPEVETVVAKSNSNTYINFANINSAKEYTVVDMYKDPENSSIMIFELDSDVKLTWPTGSKFDVYWTVVERQLEESIESRNIRI